MSVSGAIDNLLRSSGFQQQLRAIQALAMSDLQQAIQTWVYDIYTPVEYERNYSLLNSITTTDLVVTPTTIEFKVIFDEKILDHSSYGGSSKYNLRAGQEVGDLLIPWLNEGFRWDRYQGDYDMFRARPGAGFLEEAIKKIQADVISRVKNAINVEVRKTYSGIK